MNHEGILQMVSALKVIFWRSVLEEILSRETLKRTLYKEVPQGNLYRGCLTDIVQREP